MQTQPQRKADGQTQRDRHGTYTQDKHTKILQIPEIEVGVKNTHSQAGRNTGDPKTHRIRQTQQRNTETQSPERPVESRGKQGYIQLTGSQARALESERTRPGLFGCPVARGPGEWPSMVAWPGGA